MKVMRKGDDEIYQLAKDRHWIKSSKDKRFRPFCLCLPGVMFVTRGSKNSVLYPRVSWCSMISWYLML